MKKINSILKIIIQILMAVFLLSSCDNKLLDEIEADIRALTVENLTLTSPSGGETFAGVDDISFRWTSTLGKGNVKISVNDGTTETIVIGSIENGLTNAYIWNNNGLSVGDYKGRISLIEDEQIYDDSDSEFFIRDLSLTSPGTNDLYAEGGTLPVRWSSGLTTGTVRIELKRSGLAQALIGDNIPITEGAIDYTLPGGLTDSQDYTVNITYNNNTSITQDSGVFGIITDISATAPASSSDFLIGDICTIQWSGYQAGNVKLELLNNGIVESVITASTANDGSYSWTTSTSSLSGGDDYSIRISTLTDYALTDETGTFTINRWESLGYAAATTVSDLRLYGQLIAFKDSSDSSLKARSYYEASNIWTDYKSGNVSPGTIGVVSHFFKDGYYQNYHIGYSDTASNGEAKGTMGYSVSWWGLPGYASSGAVSHMDFCYGGAKDVYYMGYRPDGTGTPLSLAIFQSTAWSQLGNIISNGVDISMDMDPVSGKPFIMYRDLSGSDPRFRVVRYASGSGAGITFTSFGRPDQSTNTSSWHTNYNYKLIADPAGNPVVMFYEYNSYTLVVRRWNGSSWTTLFSQPGWNLKNAVLALMDDGTPLLAYRDANIGADKGIKILRYNSGTTWDTLGFLDYELAGEIQISGIGNKAIIVFGDWYSSPQYKPLVFRYK